MKKLVLVAALVLPALLLSRLAGADDKPTKDKAKEIEKPTQAAEKSKVGALAPSPLDSVFEKATDIDEISKALHDNELFQKAVKMALRAKQDRVQWYKEHPKGAGSTPAQAAREAFLNTLLNEPSQPAAFPKTLRDEPFPNKNP